MSSLINFNKEATMSSLEIAGLVDSRHDNVKRTIETLANKGVIEFPQIEEIKTATKPTQVFKFSGEKGKRDSIVVVAQLCPEFTAHLVDRWHELENAMKLGERLFGMNDQKKEPAPSNGLPEYRIAKAMELSLKSANKICEMLPNLGEQSRQVLLAGLLNPIVGDVIPLPILEEKTYTATEVGEMLGISSKKVGSIANALGLKIEEYGFFVLDKARHSDKQVPTFRYNDKAVLKIENELNG